jgi:O-antigen ligase
MILEQNHFVPFFRLSRVLLVLGFGMLWALVLLVAWKAPQYLPYIPAILLGLAAGWYLFQYPVANLVLAISLFVFVSKPEDGIQVGEVLYALYYLGYLAHWFFVHIFLRGNDWAKGSQEMLVWALMAWLLFSIAPALFFHGDPKEIVTDGMNWALLLFIFPIKETIRENPKNLYVFIGIWIWLGLYTAINNLVHYREIIANANFAWQVERGRAVTNENLLLIPLIFCLILLIYEQRKVLLLLYGSCFLLFLGSLILTQSRGYWVDFALGATCLFFLVKRPEKIKLLTYSSVTLLIFGLLAYFFLGNLFTLVVEGLMRRLFSIQNAAAADISLRNRFAEYAQLWKLIQQNPIIGYGMGVPYNVYDIPTRLNLSKMFSHSGILHLWYKFGFIGLGIILSLWFKTIAQGWRVWRARNVQHAPDLLQLCGLGVCICFIALLPSFNSSNPFYLKSPLIMQAVLFGMLAGIYSLYLQSPDRTANSNAL